MKVTKMINFSKLSGEKKGLGYKVGNVCSNSSTIFVKPISHSKSPKTESQVITF